ncbi:MAG: hypothetical protein B9J98_05065 [Candidatus Terraquivivens tikiterensis]|uniref:ATPase domain-containing protein n=1 Tax=Candidatus Terraquivivens tikiterensis TaxID=1980982 RepID=A0A2R7Y2T6_9ARCH|nr:MAG: hypothetical protein B9J98_05065 [Candidatus Terraquivivens tikiterensis]
MLFDLHPKENLKDLFDRETEYNTLSELVNSGRWVAVLGKRMTGKTSLVKTFAKENDGIYVNLLGAGGIEGFARRLGATGGFGLEEIGIDLKVVHLKWGKLAEGLFEKFSNKIIVLDEVQDIASPHLLKLLKYVWDTYRVRIIFSGSCIGLMRRILEPSYTSSLYGREPAKLVLKTFTPELSRNFLLEGFKQYRVRPNPDEIEEAVEKLNGYVGWLTYYGNFRCVEKMDHQKALQATIRRGVAIIKGELENFLKNRRRDLYVKVLRMAARGVRWSELKDELDVNNKVLRDVLQTLLDVMILDAENGYYQTSDPILRETVRKLPIKR